MDIKQITLKSNGEFALMEGPFERPQHTNQQLGLDLYVKVLDFFTGEANLVKLYKNTKGLHFKKRGYHYLDSFTEYVVYVPLQIIEIDAPASNSLQAN